MEFSVAVVLLAVLLTAAVGLISVVMNWIWFRPKRLEKCLRKQGFGGNPYRILVGDSEEKAELERTSKSAPIAFSDNISPRVLPFLHRTVQLYGKKSFMWLGTSPAVNMAETELIKDIFARPTEFIKQDANPLLKFVAQGVATYNGEKWAKHRRIVNPAFYQEKLKLMVPAFLESSTEMIHKWEQLVSAEGKCEIDVWPDLLEMASDSISRTAFGSNYMEGKQMFDLLNEQIDLTAKILQSYYIPGWRFVPTKTNREMKRFDKEIRTLLRKNIDKREKQIEAGEGNINDLLGLLLISNKNISNGESMLSVDDVIEECKIFYLAGQLTLTNLLYPPVADLQRTTARETNIGDIVLPAGVNVVIPILLVQRDEELWGRDACEFKPERFAGGISAASRMQAMLLFFGRGPRVCIGQNYAWVEAKLVISMILQRFSFRVSPSYAHAPHLGVIVKPQHGADLTFRRL